MVTKVVNDDEVLLKRRGNELDGTAKSLEICEIFCPYKLTQDHARKVEGTGMNNGRYEMIEAREVRK